MKTLDERLNELKLAQQDGTYTSCPRCGRDTMNPVLPRNALSRHCDLMVCSSCGQQEAMLAVMNARHSFAGWEGLKRDYTGVDFKAKTADEVMEILEKEQIDDWLGLYKTLMIEPRTWEEVNFEAHERFPGLTNFWLEPFRAHFDVDIGYVALEIRSRNGVVEYRLSHLGFIRDDEDL